VKVPRPVVLFASHFLVHATAGRLGKILTWVWLSLVLFQNQDQ
jgi:hypothetical protein